MSKGERLRLLIAFLSGILTSVAFAQIAAAAFRNRRRRAALYAKSLWEGKRLRPIIGIAGSGDNAQVKLARHLGEWCARCGFHLLVGGGRGVMTSVAQAFVETRQARESREADGLVLSVLPGLPASRASDWATAREEVSSKLLVDQSRGTLQYTVLMAGDDQPGERIVAPTGYPNKFVDVAIRTHLPSAGGKGFAALSRNHITVLSSDVLVALPGGSGTATEVELALHYGIPVCLYLGTSGIIENLSDVAAASAPAFSEFSDVKAFVCKAILAERQEGDGDSPRVRSRKRSYEGLDELG